MLNNNMQANTAVAVFIDYDNIQMSVESLLKNEPDVQWEKVLETASQYGRVILRRAYADWAQNTSAQRELMALGVDLVHVSSKRGKNAADIRIVIDAMEQIFTNNEHFSHVLLVSGDGDFTELVHRLRTAGKTVIGMGVSGSSAEYLVNACDEFLFYDRLLPQTTETLASADADKPEETPVFDIAAARLLLQRVLESSENELMHAGMLKNNMLRRQPSFHERNYGYSSFKEFLKAQNDLVQLQDIDGVLYVKLSPRNSEPREALLQKYLKILGQQKIRMTPNAYRPRIILKFFDFIKDGQISLTEAKERVHAYYEEHMPQVASTYITEVTHQLFHTYCFQFDDTQEYPEGTRLWDKKVRLAKGINKPQELLDHCDRGLLQRIARQVGSKEKIDPEVAARLLYGSKPGNRMLAHVKELLEQI